MKRLLAIAVVIGLLAGCQSNSKNDASKQWYRARGQVLCEVSKEHFKAGQLDEAGKKAVEALKLDDDLDQARLLLGKIYIEQDRYAEATEWLREVTVRQPTLVDGWYLLAVAQERNDHLAEALASYNRACELGPQNTDAVLARGEVLVAMDRVDQARQGAEEALKTHRKDAGLFEQAGRLAMMQEDYAAAADHFSNAADLECRNFGYQESQALALLLDGRHLEASKVLESLIRVPEYGPSAWAQSTLGDCYLAMGRAAEAHDAYSRSCDLDDKNPRGWCNAARAAMEMQDYHRAVIEAGEALRLEPYHRDASLLFGYALLRGGQADQALTFLRQACRVHPDSGDLRCLLGRAHEARGDRSTAARCYTQAVELEPGSRLARELLASTADGTVR